MSRGKNFTGIGRCNGDDAHVGGLGRMNAGDGIFEDNTILGGNMKCRGGLEVAIGFRFSALVATRIDDRGKIAANAKSIKNKIDIARCAACCDGAEDAGGVGLVEKFA